jgi:hypothetical protein
MPSSRNSRRIRHPQLLFAMGLLLAILITRALDHAPSEVDPAARLASVPDRKLTALATPIRLTASEVEAALEGASQNVREQRDTAAAAQARIASEKAEAIQAEKRRQLEDRAHRLEAQANARVAVLAKQLDLGDAQQDQVFQILVRTSRSYDDTMTSAGAPGAYLTPLPDTVFAAASEGSQSLARRSDAGLDAAIEPEPTPSALALAGDMVEIETTPAELAKDAEIEAIQQVLDPPQLEKYQDLLDEIDAYWDNLVVEVIEDIKVLETEDASGESPESQ